MTDERRDTEGSEIDVERLLGEIRAKRGLKAEPLPAPVDSGSESPGPHPAAQPPDDVAELRTAIENAGAHADVGVDVSPMEQFPAVLRPLARMVGKTVIYLSSFVIDRQRSFNRAVRQVLVMMTDRLERLTASQSALHDTLRVAMDSTRREQTQASEALREAVASLQKNQEQLSEDVRETLKGVHSGIGGL